jgi:hypothetical protein
MMAKKTKKKINSKKNNSKSISSKKNNSEEKTKKQIVNNRIRGEGGKLLPGVVLNPKGRPKGSKNKFSVKELAQAIEKVEQRERTGFLEAWVELAWGDVTAMGNIVQYMLPKLRSIEMSGDVGINMHSKEEAEAIQKELRRRDEER